MKAATRGLLLLGLLVSHGALAGEPVFGSTAESRHAREAQPAKGKAIIYIYRRHDDASGVSPAIWLNTFEVGRLVPGAFTAWQLSPGRLEIRAEGVETTSVSLTSEAGKFYLIRVSVTQTAAGPNARLARMPPESGRSDMAATQLLKNPRDVTAMVARAPVAPPPAAPKPAAEPAPAPQAAEAPGPLTAGGVGLLLKTGALTLADDKQQVLGFDFAFDDRASGPYGVEAYFQFRNGFAVGGEVMGYKAEFSQVGLNDKHDIDVFILFANGKKYFRTDSRLQPFIGAGIGGASTDVSGPTISGSTSGFAYQLFAGVEYRTKDIGIFGEAKYVSADTESDNKESIDVSGTGFFVGIAFHF